MGDMTAFDADLLKKVKSAKPVNIVDYASRAALNFFKGKSSVETEADVLSAIENSSFGKNAQAMLAFNERYDETKNAASAFNYASLIFPEAIGEEKPDETTTTEIELQELNDTVYQVTKKTTKNNITGESTESLATKKVEGMNTITPAKEREIVGDLNTAFNVLTDVRAQFTPQAYASYVKAADDALGTDKSLGSDLNLTDHKKVIDVYTKFATDENNLKDQFKTDAFTALISSMGDINMPAITASLAIQEDPNSPEAQEAVQQLVATQQAYYNIASMLSNMATESRSLPQIKVPEPQKNVHGISNYDQLTPAAQLRLDSMTADEFNKAYGQ